MVEEKKQHVPSAAELLGGKKDAKSKSKSKHKSKHKTTSIEHHPDGSHTVRHVPHPSADGKPTDEVSYAAKDLDELHDGLEQHLGEPNRGEVAAAPPMPMPGVQS